MITIAVLAMMVPLAILLDLLKLGRVVALWSHRRRAVPLQQRNIKRAAAGAFGLVLCLFLAAHGFPVIGWQVTAGIAAFALLYLVVGIHGRQGARFDAMSVFWWGALVLIAGAALAFLWRSE